MWLRLPAAVLALVVAAWFGLAHTQAHDIDRATARLIPPPAHLTAAQAAPVRAWLDGAATLDPDRSVALLRGRLLVAQGQLGAARHVIEPVTRAEPQNLDAWVAMALASSDDPREFRVALARVRALEPLLPGQPPRRHRP